MITRRNSPHVPSLHATSLPISYSIACFMACLSL
jgi:hypothetical protein